MGIKTIAVLTAGGDAPGMNAAVRAVVRTALANGLRVLGIRRAYEGMVQGEFCELGARDVGGIIQRGGTFSRPRVSRSCEPLEELSASKP
jgi:6-phosphofructokinase 1